MGRLRVTLSPSPLNILVFISWVLFLSLIFVNVYQDWARNHSGDPEVDAAVKTGEDPGLALVSYTITYLAQCFCCFTIIKLFGQSFCGTTMLVKICPKRTISSYTLQLCDHSFFLKTISGLREVKALLSITC